MAGDEKSKLRPEEATYARLVSVEIVLMQLLREFIRTLPEKEASEMMDKMVREGEAINEELNATQSDRDVAWKAEMASAFRLIYQAGRGAIRSDVEER